MVLKRRYIISSVLTILAVFITKTFWISEKNIDFFVLTIIVISSWLFIFKITSYLADFKSVEKKSRLDIVFLIIFFIMLLIPASYISNETKSKTENRSLAKYQPLITEKGLNSKYCSDFTNWFSDHFNGRKEMYKLYTYIKYKTARTYYEGKNGYLNKKNGWMFYKTNNFSLSEKKYKEISDNLKKLENFSNTHNLKTYIIIAPRKVDIYQDKTYPYIAKSNAYEKTVKLINYIKENNGIDIIYPYKEIEKYSKEHFAYFKPDNHWTDEAAYIGYLNLMDKIKQDFPNIYINTLDDFEYIYSNKVRVNPLTGFFDGMNLRNMALMDLYKHNDKYKYFSHKNSKKLKSNLKQGKEKSFYSYQYDENAPNMVLFGDSFTLNMLPSIVYSFNKTLNIYVPIISKESIPNMLIKNYEKDIVKNDTDILIICFSEIERLKYLFMNEEELSGKS